MSRPATGVPVNEPTTVIPGKVINSGSATIQDLPFAVAFLLAVAGMATTAFALPHFSYALEHADREIRTAQYTGADGSKAPMVPSLDYILIIKAALSAAAVGSVAFSSFWLLMMRAHARILVTAALIVPVVLFVALTLWAAYMLLVVQVSYESQNSFLVMGLIGLVGAVFSYMWLDGMWHKIPATAHCLSLSSHVIFTLPGTVLVGVATALLQMAWFALTTVAVFNAFTALAPEDEEAEGAAAAGEYEGGGGASGGPLGLAMVALLLCLYWGWQVHTH